MAVMAGHYAAYDPSFGTDADENVRLRACETEILRGIVVGVTSPRARQGATTLSLSAAEALLIERIGRAGINPRLGIAHVPSNGFPSGGGGPFRNTAGGMWLEADNLRVRGWIEFQSRRP